MIKSIEISNFQGHKNTSIQFHKGLNVITGITDAGKSSIIRALFWLIFNRPTGDYFRRWGSKDAVHVGIEFNNGWIIKERKDKTVYETENVKLEAIRSDVPEEVQMITNMNENNIQMQHQPYFLLQDTPGEVARKLNELVGLDIIDQLYKKLASKIQESKMEITRSGTQINLLLEQIKNYENLDKISCSIEKLEQNINRLEIVQGRARSTRLIMDSLDSISAKYDFYKTVLKVGEKGTIITNKIKKRNLIEQKKDSLSNCVIKLQTIEKEYKTLKERLSMEPKAKKIIGKRTDLDILIKKKDQLEMLCNKGINILNDQGEWEKHKNSIILAYTKLLKEHGICPTCGTLIDNLKLEEVKRRLFR